MALTNAQRNRNWRRRQKTLANVSNGPLASMLAHIVHTQAQLAQTQAQIVEQLAAGNAATAAALANVSAQLVELSRTPLATHFPPTKTKPSPKPAAPKLPLEPWQPNARHYELASARHHDAAWVDDQAEAYADWLSNKPPRYHTDRDAGFRNWLKREADQAEPKTVNHRHTSSRDEARANHILGMEMARKYFEEIDDRNEAQENQNDRQEQEIHITQPNHRQPAATLLDRL